MELDTRPASAKFTAAREVRIVSELGNMCANFEAGQTRQIPKALFNAALLAGLIPEEPLDAPPKVVENKSQKVAVEEGLKEACTKLILRGKPQDFTVNTGYPRAASVKKLVDFDFTTNDVRRAFEEAMHEVDQDGDDRTEHTEPSSSVTE